MPVAFGRRSGQTRFYQLLCRPEEHPESDEAGAEDTEEELGGGPPDNRDEGIYG